MQADGTTQFIPDSAAVENTVSAFTVGAGIRL